MDQITFFWTLVSTVLAGLTLFIQKVVAEERRSSAFNGFFMYGASGVFAIILFAALQELPVNWEMIALFGFMGGALHGLGNFIRIEALRSIDSVLYFPLNKMFGPLLVVMGGVIFFADHLTVTQYVGIGFSLSVPLLLVSSVEQHRQKNLWLGLKLLLVSTALTAASLLVMKQGYAYGTAVLLMLCASQTAGMLASAAILWKQHGAGFAMITHADRRDVMIGSLSAIFGLGSAYALFMALSTGLVSLVYVIQAHYILIPIILSVWWYGDHINVRKFAAVAVSFLAITMLYTG